MRILITGKNGQVGTELSRLYHSRGDVVLTGRDECDLSSEQSIRDTVRPRETHGHHQRRRLHGG